MWVTSLAKNEFRPAEPIDGGGEGWLLGDTVHCTTWCPAVLNQKTLSSQAVNKVNKKGKLIC